MKGNRSGCRRVLAILLSVILMTSNLGLTAFADEVISEPVEVYVDEEVFSSDIEAPPQEIEIQLGDELSEESQVIDEGSLDMFTDGTDDGYTQDDFLTDGSLDDLMTFEEGLFSEPEPVPFKQTYLVRDREITVTADAGVFPTDAVLYVDGIDDVGIAQAAGDALGISASDTVLISHALYSFSGTEMNGTAVVKMAPVGFAALREAYPGASITPYVMCWDGDYQEAQMILADFDTEQDEVAFALPAMTVYDLMTVVQLPEQETIESTAEEQTEQPADVQEEEVIVQFAEVQTEGTTEQISEGRVEDEPIEPLADETFVEDAIVEIQPVSLAFNATPETAVVTVYPAATEEVPEPEVIPAQEDGSFLLLPGEYTYTAEAEGYVSIENAPFTVTGDEQPMMISFEMEAVAEEIPEPMAFEQSRTVNGVVVTVKADPGVFPAGAELSVETVPVYQQLQADAAVDEVRDENQNVAVSYTFDIKVINPETGEEYQPADGQTVSVSFALAEVADENLETQVYHVTEDETTGEMTAKSLDVNTETTPETGEGTTAVVETDGFSIYTVEFTYNTLEYVLPGDTSVPMSEILTTLGLTGEVTAVEISNTSLFSASNETGEWIVTAHQAFDSTEWMKVTINDVVYEITVTDTTTEPTAVGGTDYTLFTGFTATDGTAVDNAFVYGNMVDGDLSSSFHVFTSPAYVEFNTDDPIIPNGYIFNTFNASSFKPTGWVLKAKANTADEWTTLSSKSGSLASGQEFQYACDNSGNNAYKYFRFEVSNSNNNIWLTEIRLYGNMSYTHIAVKAATCTETGIKQECWRRTDGKYFTDETGTTELAESDVIAPMKPHTAEHHAATSTNIEYWTCSVCGKYFSDEACTTEITEAETQTTVFGTLANGCYTLTSQTYTLTEDVNTAGYIYIPAGVTATIDLAGHTIDRGLTSAVANGYVIKVAGTLTLTDSGTGGTVKGGMYDEYTSCVYVPDGGTFTLAGGTLIGNTSDEGNRAVYVAFSAHFIMTGGKITGDVCGINASGHLTISGGEISGNSQRGIYPGSYSISVSGNPRITGNGDVNVNLYYDDAARLTVTGALTEGASIGITPHGTPTANAPVTVTSGYGTYNTASPDTYFTLDNNSFVLGWNEDRTEVAVGTALYTVDFDMNGHGSAIDAVSLLSGYKVLEPTVPTADDWYFVGWYTDAACTAGNEWNFDDAVTSNKTLHAKWTQTAIHSITLPEKMVIVSADQEAVGGKYPVGTNIRFKVKSADYVVDGDVKNGEDVLTADGDGIYTVTMGDADITITATIKKAAEPNVTLSGSDNYTANDDDVLTGSTSGTLTIPDGAKVTLSDVTISGGIVCSGTATITLVGTNSVSNTWYSSAGIQIGGSGTTLTIKGNGSLNATGGSASAGIGLGRTWDANATGGSVVIEGGTVTASGGNGIGTGTVGNSMTAHVDGIIIKGGTVNARLGKGTINNGSTATIGTIKIYDGIEKVDASAITESVTYMHDDTDVTASASTYFTIIEDGDRRIIEKKDDTDYSITIADNTEHGTIECAATTAKYGDKVTITTTSDFGYRFDHLIVKDADNNDVASTGNSFFMPKSNVTVSAVFEQGTHGTTEFAWGYAGPEGYVTDATIYDGVTTVNLQQERSYSIIKYSGYSYSKFLLDNDTYNVNIPYAGGTGAFVQNGTSFNNNGEAGYYDITMTDAGNGKWSVSILKTVGQMDVVPDQTYTGSAITPEPLVLAGSLSLTKGTDYEYSYTDNTDVGSATVRATFLGDYAALGSVEKEFAIVKAAPTVTAPTAKTDLIYTGSALALISAGSTDFGTLLYSTDGTNYSAEIPTATEAGTYTVYYKVEASDNWNAVDAQTVEVTIAPGTYTVNFDANGGEGTLMASQSFTCNVEQALTTNTFTRAGYDFAGWNTVAAPTAENPGTPYTDGQSVSNLTTENNGTVTLYAQWTQHDYSLTIAGTSNGTVTAKVGEMDNVATAHYNDTVTLTVTPAEGYALDTLTVKQGETDVTVKNNQFTMPKANVTVRATFKELPKYTVTFEAGEGATGTMDPVTVAQGEAYTLPDASAFTAPASKAFKEWSVKIGDAEAVSKQPDDTIEVTANTTVTAVWEDAAAAFAMQNLALGEQIGVRFWMDLSSLSESEKATGVMTFTVHGSSGKQTVTYAQAETDSYNGVTYPVFRCRLSSVQMNDEITAAFSYEKAGNTVSISKTYTVKEYIQAFDTVAASYPDAMVKLVHALADYGHYSQPFLSSYWNWTVGVDHADMDLSYSTPDQAAAKTGTESLKAQKTENKDVEIKYALLLDTKTSICVYFIPKNGYSGSVTAQVNGKNAAVKQLTSGSYNGWYQVTIEGLGPKELGDMYTVTATTDSGNAKIELSAMSYVYTVLDGNYYAEQHGSEAMAALYFYYDAAKAFN